MSTDKPFDHDNSEIVEAILKMKLLFRASMDMEDTEDIAVWLEKNPDHKTTIENFSKGLKDILYPKDKKSVLDPPGRPLSVNLSDTDNEHEEEMKLIIFGKKMKEYKKYLILYQQKMSDFIDYEEAITDLLVNGDKKSIISLLNNNTLLLKYLKANIQKLEKANASFLKFTRENIKARKDKTLRNIANPTSNVGPRRMITEEDLETVTVSDKTQPIEGKLKSKPSKKEKEEAQIKLKENRRQLMIASKDPEKFKKIVSPRVLGRRHDKIRERLSELEKNFLESTRFSDFLNKKFGNFLDLEISGLVETSGIEPSTVFMIFNNAVDEVGEEKVSEQLTEYMMEGPKKANKIFSSDILVQFLIPSDILKIEKHYKNEKTFPSSDAKYNYENRLKFAKKNLKNSVVSEESKTVKKGIPHKEIPKPVTSDTWVPRRGSLSIKDDYKEIQSILKPWQNYLIQQQGKLINQKMVYPNQHVNELADILQIIEKNELFDPTKLINVMKQIEKDDLKLPKEAKDAIGHFEKFIRSNDVSSNTGREPEKTPRFPS